MSYDLVEVINKAIKEQVEEESKSIREYYKEEMETFKNSLSKLEMESAIQKEELESLKDTILVLGSPQFKKQHNALKDLIAEAAIRCLGYNETESIVFKRSLTKMIYGGICRMLGVPNSVSISMENYEDPGSDFNTACNYAKQFKLSKDKANEMVGNLKLRVAINTWKTPRILECANLLLNKPIASYNLVRNAS